MADIVFKTSSLPTGATVTSRVTDAAGEIQATPAFTEHDTTTGLYLSASTSLAAGSGYSIDIFVDGEATPSITWAFSVNPTGQAVGAIQVTTTDTNAILIEATDEWPITRNEHVVQGRDFVRVYKATSAGTDFTSATLKGEVRNEYGDDATLLATMITEDITTAIGSMQWTGKISNTVTDGLDIQTNVYDWEITLGDGTKLAPIRGTLTILNQVSR